MELSLLFFVLLQSCVISRSETVELNPRGDVTVCPNEIVEFTCRTTGGALVWITGNNEHVFNEPSQATVSNLGIFLLELIGLRKNGSAVVDVNSTATTLVGFRLEDNNTTLSCLVGTDLNNPEAAVLKLADPPQAPVVIPIIQQAHGIQNSALVLSWSISGDCAVQYVVAINSSDGSVYSNITTSDTNTTVTLPNGVEYCVTVAAVDAFGRRSPDSVPSCFALSIPTSTSAYMSPEDMYTGTSALSPTQSPSVVEDSLIAVYIVVPILVVIMVTVVVGYFAILILLYTIHQRKGIKQSYTVSEFPCTCQVFQKLSTVNNWQFVFALSTSSHYNVVKCYYQSEGFEKLEQCEAVVNLNIEEITFKVSDRSNHRWTAKIQDGHKLSKTVVQQYNGDGVPPHCEMIVKPDDNFTPPNLKFIVIKLNETSININKELEAQNTLECLVKPYFMRMEEINTWKAIIVFFPKEKLEQVENIYQDLNNCEHHQLVFSRGTFSVSALDKTEKWIVVDTRNEIHTNDIEGYNMNKDENAEPPFYIVTLKLPAAAANDTFSDLSLQVNLSPPVKQPSSIELTRVAEIHLGVPIPKTPTVSTAKVYICQVFYHKEGINLWKATLAFLPQDKIDRVKEFYQDANIGPMINFTPETGTFRNVAGRVITKLMPAASLPVIVDDFIKSIIAIKYDTANTAEEWIAQLASTSSDKVNMSDVQQYTGEDKPPQCEIILTSDRMTCVVLKKTITLDGVNPPNTITLKRMSEEFDSHAEYDNLEQELQIESTV